MTKEVLLSLRGLQFDAVAMDGRSEEHTSELQSPA